MDVDQPAPGHFAPSLTPVWINFFHLWRVNFEVWWWWKKKGNNPWGCARESAKRKLIDTEKKFQTSSLSKNVIAKLRAIKKKKRKKGPGRIRLMRDRDSCVRYFIVFAPRSFVQVIFRSSFYSLYASALVNPLRSSALHIRAFFFSFSLYRMAGLTYYFCSEWRFRGFCLILASLFRLDWFLFPPSLSLSLLFNY